jgi:hypothetical protein
MPHARNQGGGHAKKGLLKILPGFLGDISDALQDDGVRPLTTGLRRCRERQLPDGEGLAVFTSEPRRF